MITAAQFEGVPMWRQSSSQTIAIGVFGFIALGAAILADHVRLPLRVIAAGIGIFAFVLISMRLL